MYQHNHVHACRAHMIMSRAVFKGRGRGFSPCVLRYILGFFDIKPTCNSNWDHRLFFVYPHVLQKLLTALHECVRIVTGTYDGNSTLFTLNILLS